MKRILLPTLLALAACGTPQEQCINKATRDMRVVDRLITETQGNLQRGYGFEEVTVYRDRWVNCTPAPTEATPSPEPKMCLDEVSDTERRPVALDLRAEAVKLQGLQEKRAQQAKAATKLIKECKAQYPE
jgi:hypothetical protein